VQSIVYAIDQDKYGNIWLATEAGIVRNNSTDSFLYDKYYGLPQGVSNRVSKVFIDSAGRIWIGKLNGLCLYIPKEDKFRLISKKKDDSQLIIRKISEDSSGNIWVIQNSSLWKCTLKGGQYVLNEIVNASVSLLYSINSSIYYGDNKSLFLLNTVNNTSVKTAKFPLDVSLISMARKIGKTIFIGTVNGKLFKTDDKFSNFISVLDDSRKKNYDLKDIVLYYKNYYLSSDGAGVFMLDTNFNIIKQYSHNEDDSGSISSNSVYDLFIDR